jgi:hypothetical protein
MARTVRQEPDNSHPSFPFSLPFSFSFPPVSCFGFSAASPIVASTPPLSALCAHPTTPAGLWHPCRWSTTRQSCGCWAGKKKAQTALEKLRSCSSFARAWSYICKNSYKEENEVRMVGGAADQIGGKTEEKNQDSHSGEKTQERYRGVHRKGKGAAHCLVNMFLGLATLQCCLQMHWGFHTHLRLLFLFGGMLASSEPSHGLLGTHWKGLGRPRVDALVR